MRILLGHSNPETIKDIQYSFSRDGDQLLTAGSLDGCRQLYEAGGLDFVLLDSLFKDGSVLDLLREIHIDPNLPIIILGQSPDPKEAVLCMEYGCDHYLHPPLDLLELKACMRVSLRLRKAKQAESSLSEEVIGSIRFNLLEHSLSYGKKRVVLAAREFELLYQLAQQGGAGLSRQELVEKIWPEEEVSPRTLDVYVRRIRDKLEGAGLPSLIQTEWGEGYSYQDGDIEQEI